jgi:hypothetical protein
LLVSDITVVGGLSHAGPADCLGTLPKNQEPPRLCWRFHATVIIFDKTMVTSKRGLLLFGCKSRKPLVLAPLLDPLPCYVVLATGGSSTRVKNRYKSESLYISMMSDVRR